MGTRGSPGSQGCQVTSTAASVGPYRLCSSVCGRRSWQRAASSAPSASPEQMTRRSAGRAGSSRKSSSMDGTKCMVVTSWAVARAARRAPSRWASGSATTSPAPVMSGQNSSHTDTSNDSGVLCSTRSSGASPNVSCIHSSRLTIARCETPTPLGRPVEPEVKITYASESGCTRVGAPGTSGTLSAGSGARPETARAAGSGSESARGSATPSGRTVVPSGPVSTVRARASSIMYASRSGGSPGSRGR